MAISDFPIQDISHLIPQKNPFVMVDSLIEFTDESLVSNFLINSPNVFLEKGVLLEPGLVENMAQTVALHTGYAYFLKGEEAPTGYIGSIKKVEIFGLPKVGETLRTEVHILHEFMGVTMVNVEVFDTEKKVLASAQMKTVIAN